MLHIRKIGLLFSITFYDAFYIYCWPLAAWYQTNKSYNSNFLMYFLRNYLSSYIKVNNYIN